MHTTRYMYLFDIQVDLNWYLNKASLLWIPVYPNAKEYYLTKKKPDNMLIFGPKFFEFFGIFKSQQSCRKQPTESWFRTINREFLDDKLES